MSRPRVPSLLTTLLIVLTFAPAAFARHGPKDATILIIRHAEKAEDKNDPGLSKAGRKRASLYPEYFSHLTLDGQPVHIDYLFAAKVTPQSDRPHLTITPLSESLHLPMKLMFEEDQYQNLARDLITGEFDHKTTLICWHHSKIPELIRELGGKPKEILGPDQWLESVYGWMVVLRFGPTGELKEGYVLNEHLTPDDTKEPPARPKSEAPPQSPK
jgi:hypothetical protein